METKKRHTALWVVLTVLLGLALAKLCWLAAGPESLTPSFFRYGFYPLENVPASSAVYLPGEGIITDRNAPVAERGVTFTYQGREEVVIWRVFYVGRVVAFLHANALSVWALCAAAAVVCAILWITAPRRRIRRMQEQMRKTFAACGAKYDREDENIDY